MNRVTATKRERACVQTLYLSLTNIVKGVGQKVVECFR